MNPFSLAQAIISSMTSLEASLSTFSFPSKFPSLHKPSITNLGFRNSATVQSLNLPFRPFNNPSRRLISATCTATAAETVLESKTEKSQPSNSKRKLFVLNLPWSLTVAEIKELFGQCGTVSDVEIIKQKDGRNEEFVFVTMASGEEAQAAVDKLHSQEVSGRTIRVDFARKFKKPSSKITTAQSSSTETRWKLYVSNLAWKVRSTHLREFLAAANLNAVTARVVFGTADGRGAGYGFVSFATRDEAESAIATLNGKELMGRPIRLKLTESDANESENKRVAEDFSEGQPDE